MVTLLHCMDKSMEITQMSNLAMCAKSFKMFITMFQKIPPTTIYHKKPIKT